MKGGSYIIKDGKRTLVSRTAEHPVPAPRAANGNRLDIPAENSAGPGASKTATDPVTDKAGEDTNGKSAFKFNRKETR